MVAEKIFAESIIKDIKSYLPLGFQDVECTIMENQKNNGVQLVGISFRLPEQQISPIIYVRSFYNKICQGESVEKVMIEIAECVEKSMKIKVSVDVVNMTSYDAAKKYLTPVLVNTKANRHMLTTMPHREIEDLSLICVMRFMAEEMEGSGTINVTNEMIENWEVNVEQVYQMALENAIKEEPPTLKRMTDVMEEIFTKQETKENLFVKDDNFRESIPDSMYVLTNQSKINGAAVLAYPDVMKKISKLFPEGVYILPSSIHELLIIPQKEGVSPRDLGEMVREVNHSQLQKEEILSDRVYEYNKERGKICQVAESIKRGKEMER